MKGVWQKPAGLRGRQLSPTIGAAGSAGLYRASGLFGVYCLVVECRRHVRSCPAQLLASGILRDATVLAPMSTHNGTNV